MTPRRVEHARVMIVIAQLDVGGAETQVVRLARGLRRIGVHVEVATFYAGGTLEPDLIAEGVPVQHLRRSSKVGHETIGHLRALLAERRIDVVHSFLWPANWRARIAAVLAGTPVVVSSTRSVETWLTPVHVAIDRLLARWTDRIVVNAEAIRDYLVERESLPRGLFEVIPNGVDDRLFDGVPDRAGGRRRTGLDAAGPVVLAVGNLQPEKNHEDFVRTAALVRRTRPDVTFVSVGSGPRVEELRAMAEDLGVGDALRWEGFRRNVWDYLAAADVVMNVSEREGCCNAIVEAMVGSRPVVAYAVGGNPELVVDGATGRLHAFGDVDGLAASVLAYVDDPGLAVAHGRAGRRRAENRHRVDAMIGRTVRLYEELLESKGVS